VTSPQPGQSPTDRGGEGSRVSRFARGRLFEVVETLVLTVVIFVGIQTFVAQPFKIEGASMEMTLLPEQYVLIDKLTPHWAPYARGEIIVLDPPDDEVTGSGTPFIKRVIGLPGDRVQLRDGAVLVNGNSIDEPYVFAEDGVRQSTDPSFDEVSEWLVPDGQLFVLGDHRHDSSDSRVFGPIEISHVIGRAWLRYWPLDAFGILQLYRLCVV
jgi:signal peptidase I